MPHYRVLTGPTASGKTAALLARASRRLLLLISADSRQVYRGMDIGTGKATADEQALLPHCCIDLIAPDAAYSAHAFLLDASAALRSAQAQAREVWLCGGTGLYIRSLLGELELGTPPRPRLRRAVSAMLSELGPQAVAAHLALSVRENANPIRVQRAAELACVDENSTLRVYEQASLSKADALADALDAEAAGAQASAARAELAGWQCAGIAVLDPGRSELARRIETRVAAMFAGGLLEETQLLRDRGYGTCPVVCNGIAYAEAGLLLDGQLSRDAAVSQAVTRSKQYAKRQRTYFRGQGWPVMDPAQFTAWADTSLD